MISVDIKIKHPTEDRFKSNILISCQHRTEAVHTFIKNVMFYCQSSNNVKNVFAFLHNISGSKLLLFVCVQVHYDGVHCRFSIFKIDLLLVVKSFSITDITSEVYNLMCLIWWFCLLNLFAYFFFLL